MYSIQTAVSDGTLTMLALSIEYPRRDYIHVYFDGVEQTEGDTWDWVGVNDKAITFSPAVPDGVVVRVQRITPLDTVPNIFGSATPPYVGYAEFDADTVDENFRQTLQVAQESVDRTDEAIAASQHATNTSELAQSEAAAAVSTANAAASTANDAYDIATGIDAKAQQALDNSADAVNTANGIAGTANSALVAANSAVNTANSAESTANAIAGTANTALSTANNAELIASGAADDAALALSTANGIAGTANDALDLAADALQKTANLSDLTNTTTARSNLGLGNSATLNVGTAAGTVAAGDDSRIVNAVPGTRQIIAGTGLTGGGNLSANRTLSVQFSTTAEAQALANDTKALTPKKLGDVIQPTVTGSITLNGTTDNAVVMTDIVTELALEIGDVIRVDTGAYNKLHTVESITDNSSIIVNYEHAGNRGDGSLKLSDFTGQATVTRIAKWFNAPIGMGKAWVNLTATRLMNVEYSYITNASLSVIISHRWANESNGFTVDGVFVPNHPVSGIASERVVCSFVAKQSYEFNGGNTFAVLELR